MALKRGIGVRVRKLTLPEKCNSRWGGWAQGLLCGCHSRVEVLTLCVSKSVNVSFCNIVCLCDFNWVTQYIFNCVTLCVPCCVCLKVCNCVHVFFLCLQLCDTVCLVVWKLQAVTSLSLWVSATSNDAMLASHKIFGQSCEILSFSSPPPEQCFLTPSSGLDAHWDFTQVWRRGNLLTLQESPNKTCKVCTWTHFTGTLQLEGEPKEKMGSAMLDIILSIWFWLCTEVTKLNFSVQLGFKICLGIDLIEKLWSTMLRSC